MVVTLSAVCPPLARRCFASHLAYQRAPTSSLKHVVPQQRRTSSGFVLSSSSTSSSFNLNPICLQPDGLEIRIQLKRHSTSASLEIDQDSSPWNDDQIQSYLAKIGARVNTGSVEEAGGTSPSLLSTFKSLEDAFTDAADAREVGDWLGSRHLTEKELFNFVKVFELDSWSACSSFLHEQSISYQWPVSVLLHALSQVSDFQEAVAAQNQVAAQISTMQPATAVLALASLMDALCVQTAAVHLFHGLTDLMVKGMHLVLNLPEGERSSLAPWSREFTELLEDYIVLLTRWADHRSRESALRIVVEVDRFAQQRFISNDLSNSMRFLLCGITRREHSPALPVSRTSHLQRDRPTSEAYDWEFLHDQRWELLVQDTGTSAEGEQLLFSTMLASAAAHGNQYEQFKHISALIDTLQRQYPCPSPVWQASMIQYIRAILTFRKHSTNKAINLAHRVLHHALPFATGKSKSRLWRAFFRCGVARLDVDPNFFLNMLSAATMGQPQSSHVDTPFGVLPNDDCLRDGSLYDCLLAGLSRKQTVSTRDVKAGHIIWRHMIERGISPSSQAVINMARLSIMGGYWLDAFSTLKYLARDVRALTALSSLRDELAEIGIPLLSFTSGGVPLPKNDDDAKKDDIENINIWASRALLACAMSANQSLASYSIWKHAPTIFGAPLDAFSLANLLRAALELSNRHSGSEDLGHLPILWDGKSPLRVAQGMFRQIFLFQHPDLAKENTALDAMGRGQDWFTRSEVQIRRLEEWTSDTWHRWTHASRHLKELTGVGEAKRTVAGGEADWSSIVFNARLFELYLVVWFHMRYLGNESAGSNWPEPLQVLSWMRRLNIEPTTDSLSYVSQFIWETLPPAVGVLMQNEELPMGPLQQWCEEWIRPEVFPTMEEVQRRTSEQFKWVRGVGRII